MAFDFNQGVENKGMNSLQRFTVRVRMEVFNQRTVEHTLGYKGLSFIA